MVQMERRLRAVTRGFEDVRVGRGSTIREAAQRGVSIRQIAELTGLSHQRVSRTIKSGS